MCNTKQRGNRFAPVVIDDHHICVSCVTSHNHPGKFEKYSWYNTTNPPNLEELAKVLILYSFSLNNSEDAFCNSEGWGYLGQFGNYLLTEDTQGFVEFEEFDSPEAAYKEFERLFNDGWGADEYDAYIESNGFKYSVSFLGKSLEVWTNNRGTDYDQGITLRRCRARVRLEAIKTGMYPNLWYVSDHGNLSLLSY